jgi:excisionase family DNA binding protein
MSKPPAAMIPSVVIPQGDGSYIIRAGRPIDRLSPRQVAARLGVSRNTVYRYIEEGTIPDRYLEFVGSRKIYILASAVSWLLDEFRKKREAA